MTQRFPNKIFTLFFCSTGREKDAQLCVYVGNEKVVDLWGSPSQAYTADTLTTVFSRHCHFTWFFMANLSLHLLFFFSLILILAQRAWQPLPWHPSMTKGCWITRRGKKMDLDHYLGSGSLIIGQSLVRRERRRQQWPTWWDMRWHISDWETWDEAVWEMNLKTPL